MAHEARSQHAWVISAVDAMSEEDNVARKVLEALTDLGFDYDPYGLRYQKESLKKFNERPCLVGECHWQEDYDLERAKVEILDSIWEI